MNRVNIPLFVLLGKRRLIILGGFLLFCVASWILGPRIISLTDASDPMRAIGDFFGSLFHPTLKDQNPSLPKNAAPFSLRLFEAWLLTIRYALIAMSLAVPFGAALGFFASNAWWPDGTHRTKVLLRPLYYASRLLIAFMRSIHELIWVMFFLSAIGDEPLTACVAIAIPFAGTLAKVFSEITEEQSRAARKTLIATGASPLQAYFGSLLPQALPDFITYTLYRFECAIRSAAVLGFIGIETIGFTIHRSFENFYWREVWTELYVLIFTVLSVEVVGSLLRKRLNTSPVRKHLPKNITLANLKKTRPSWKFIKTTYIFTGLAAACAWVFGNALTADRLSGNRLERLERFFTKLTPEPVRESGNWSDALPWFSELWIGSGAVALANTIAISSAAIVLAATMALAAAPWASRALANIHPLGLIAGKSSPVLQAFWKTLGSGMRWVFILARAIPEYIIAYLLIGLLGPGAWPLVFALALHNFGIFGRLWSEVVENQNPATARQLVQSGGSRASTSLIAILPQAFNRFLLYFFYRWETCIREATILGMLGISSLGFHISIARNHLKYDQMLFFVILGMLAVIILDIISSLLRSKLGVRAA